jgi:hypothetical protein
MKKLVISESELTKLIQKAVETKLNEDIESEFSVEPNVPKTPTEDRLEDVFGKYSGEVPADVVRYMRKNPKLIITRLLDIYGQKMVNYMVDSLSSQIEDDVENLAEGSADENNDGVISPDELYRHFDLDGDGVVTMADYAAHVDFHCENPDLLQGARESEEYISKMEQDRGPFVQFFSPSEVMMEQEEGEEEMVNKYPVKDFDFELTDSDMMDIYDHKGPTRRFRGSIYIDDLVPETDDREYDREVAKKMMEFYRKQIKNQESYVGGVGFKQRSLMEPYDNMDF